MAGVEAAVEVDQSVLLCGSERENRTMASVECSDNDESVGLCSACQRRTCEDRTRFEALHQKYIRVLTSVTIYQFVLVWQFRVRTTVWSSFRTSNMNGLTYVSRS